MVTAGRFMLQARLFYHMLKNRALIDFHNYKIINDVFVIVVIGGAFFMSVIHILLDVLLPPYAGVQRLTNICTVYIVPCAIFFGLYDQASDVERHFVPLTKFYEENPAHAKTHLGASELYLEEELKHASVKSRKQTRAHSKGTYGLEQLIKETLKVAQPYKGQVAHQSKISRNLFKGLWPAKLLLDPRLCDEDSISFKRVWTTFFVMFIFIQAAVMTCLIMSGCQELYDAQADHYPIGSVEVGGAHFEHVGVGYCREIGMETPDGYYTALSKLVAPPNLEAGPPRQRQRRALAVADTPEAIPEVFEPKATKPKAAAVKRKKAKRSRSISVQPDVLPYSFLETFEHRSHGLPFTRERDPEEIALEEWHKDSAKACAKHCASVENCGAYAVDQDRCTIYLKVAAKSPEGWSDFIERAAKRDAPAVVEQTNAAYGVDCWKKLDGEEDPHEYMGAIVCFTFAAIVLVVAIVFIYQIRRHVSD